MKRLQSYWPWKAGDGTLVVFLLSLTPALAAALSIPFFEMAYEHQALSYEENVTWQWVLYSASWPVVILESISKYTDHLFYNSHVQGSGFWQAFTLYVTINTLGWFVSLKTIISVKRWYSKSFCAQGAGS